MTKAHAPAPTWLSPAILFVVITAGCNARNQTISTLQKEANQLKIENIELVHRLAARDSRIADLEDQLENLRQQGVGDMPRVFDVDRIEILDITSGTDLDGIPGDDGVAVYFRPVDRDGDVLKREGEILVKLLDNTTLGEPRLLGPPTVVNDPARLRESWYGRFWTDFYKVEAPFFPDAVLPANQEVDVYVRFLDWGSGRDFTARTVVEVNLINPDEEPAP